jgi:hypothetical protein
MKAARCRTTIIWGSTVIHGPGAADVLPIGTAKFHRCLVLALYAHPQMSPLRLEDVADSKEGFAHPSGLSRLPRAWLVPHGECEWAF